MKKISFKVIDETAAEIAESITSKKTKKRGYRNNFKPLKQ